MPSDQSAVSVLIQEVLSDPDLAHGDVFRRLLQAGLQDLIDAEATAQIGAGPYERSSARSNRRNGKRSKKLATTAGEVDLAIPKLRQGSFFPSLLSPRKRVDKALYAVICSAWIEGVSTRKVDDLVRALGNESGISRSTVSRICKDIDEAVGEFLTRPLEHTWFPYVFVDATYVDVRVNHRVVSQALVVATGVSASDAHPGTRAAVKAILPGASWQRCRVHFARNITSRLGSARSKPVNALISTIFAQTSRQAVTAQYQHVIDSLRPSFPQVADMLTEAEADLTAFAAFPKEHWPKIWSNNPIERLNREIKRRADVVQVFPDRQSVTRLIGAVLLEQHEEWQYGERRYLSETSLRHLTHTLHHDQHALPHHGTITLTP